MEVISSIYNSGYNIKKFYLGSRELNLAYLGNQVIYDEVIGDNDLNYILYEFYVSDTLPNTVEAPVKSAILKGQTLVNRFDFEPIFEQRSGGNWDIENKGNGVYTITAKKNKVGLRGWFINHPEVNQTHTMIFEVFENTSTTGHALLWARTQMTNVTCNMDGEGFGAGEIGVYKLVGRGKSANGYAIVFENAWNTGESITFRLTWLDGDHYYLDSGRNIGSVKLPVLKTIGKNLFDASKWISGRPSPHTGSSINRIENTQGSATPIIECKPNTTYTISRILPDNSTTNWYALYGYNKDGFKVQHIVDTQHVGKKTFTTNNDVYYLRGKSDNPYEIGKNELWQIEEGSVATSYEPYKTNILTVNEDVTLRSNGDICDELNLLTGQLTQRIGEDGVVLSQEVVKTVDLTIVDQDGKTINKLNSFNGTTHISTEVAENSAYPMVSLEVASELQAAMSKVAEDIELIKPVQNDIETTIDTQSNDIDSLLLATTELFEMFL